MDNTYYINDGYFSNILKNYFNNKNWNRVLKKNSRNCTFNHTNFEKKCTDCTYTNRFKSLKVLDHKGNLYKKMQDKSYITNYFVFNSVKGLNKYKKLFDNKKYWLIKPELGMRQEGIAISNKYSDIINHITKYKKDRKWVCMEYIANPMLYKGKKTHFRVYVLIIKREDGFECYLYKKGYMYIADEKYKLKDFTNPNIHITTSCNNQEFPKKFNELFQKCSESYIMQ